MSVNVFRSDIAAFKADLHNSLYVDIGERATFTHRGANPVTVNVWPAGQGDLDPLMTLGVRSQITKQNFIMPVQATFAGGTDSVIMGDTIAWNGDTYVTKDITWDAFSAVVTLKTVKTTGLSIQAA